MGTPERWSGDRPETGSRWRSLLGRGRSRSAQPPPQQPPPAPSPPPHTQQSPRRNAPPAHYSPPPYQSQPSTGSYNAPAQRARPSIDERRMPPGPPPAQRSAPPQQPRAATVDPAVVDLLRRPLSRSKVVAFINPKGGVHKTTATVLTAAALGTARGKGIIAWDDNELRGTLGLRAGTARHARTIRHLVEHLPQVEAAGVHLPEHLDEFLRHSSDGSFDVLAGDEDPKLQRHLDPSTVLRVLDILTRTHEIICIDTGNNVESPNWRTIVSSVDRLVVTTVPREDAAFAADWMLDLLEENGYSHLVSEAITLLSCPTPNPGPLLNDFSQHFRSRTGGVAVVPYDPALEPGAKIEFSNLRDSTRVAWTNAAATILNGL